jgi:hypothetical protein
LLCALKRGPVAETRFFLPEKRFPIDMQNFIRRLSCLYLWLLEKASHFLSVVNLICVLLNGRSRGSISTPKTLFFGRAAKNGWNVCNLIPRSSCRLPEHSCSPRKVGSSDLSLSKLNITYTYTPTFGVEDGAHKWYATPLTAFRMPYYHIDAEQRRF